VALLAVLAALAPGPRAGATGPALYLTWHAPYGMPGASDTLALACGDTARVDTLYLSFEVPRPMPPLASLRGVLYFHPQPGDTLRNFWFFKSGWANGGNMLIDFDPYPGQPCAAPWVVDGEPVVTYDHRSGRGRLDLSYTVPAAAARGLEPGVRYCCAHVRIFHRRPELEGCTQRVCVEWGGARLGFATGRQLDIPVGGSRFVGWNADPGRFWPVPRGLPLTRPWLPRVKAATDSSTR
jgi:hypothetical protein